MMHLVLDGGLRAHIEAHARAEFPQECCGLVEGVRRGGFIEAHTLHATRNVATEADRFEIDPAEHIHLLRAARVAGREIVGCYHSHPNGRPDPSATDCEHADEEGFVWLIASLVARDAPVLLRAYVVEIGIFKPLAVNAVSAIVSGADKDTTR